MDIPGGLTTNSHGLTYNFRAFATLCLPLEKDPASCGSQILPNLTNLANKKAPIQVGAFSIYTSHRAEYQGAYTLFLIGVFLQHINNLIPLVHFAIYSIVQFVGGYP